MKNDVEDPSLNGGRKILRGWAALVRKIGKSRVQGWRDVREGRLPPPLELGPNSIGWFEDEIDACWRLALAGPTSVCQTLPSLRKGVDLTL